MLILLPPSETKRDGGLAESALNLGSLQFPELTTRRRLVSRAVRRLASDADATIAALGLGSKQHSEVARNRRLFDSPTMPAVDRFAGVLYDALDAPNLSEAERGFASECLVIHSALFGLVGALDPIPAYRLSAESRLPGLSLREVWSTAIAGILAGTPGLILDLRSEAYAKLGPAPARADSRYLRVVTTGPDGRTRALNHFNKQGKGRFVRALLSAQNELASVAELTEWAASEGIALEPGRPGELDLVVSAP